ncbi:alpha/beta hydrolase fold domain-containing protein [Mycobacterium marinum]|uniref:alpha/beta hydrolase fold domain-containing protein n=1 Tax=Mycobacterium marinum TaxID=1781 RepID=UPI003569C8E3
MTTFDKLFGPPYDAIRPRRNRRVGRRAASGHGAHVEVVESGPSIAARVVSLASRLTVRPVIAVASHFPHLPWPWSLVDFALLPITWASGIIGERVSLPNASGHLVRASGVPPPDGSRRVVLYMHGGAFLKGGIHSHARLAGTLSKFADSPLLVVNYRLVPKHTVGMALEDCHDAYLWLRRRGHAPEQIVLAGDSAGGYLAFALAQRLRARGEEPAALVAISPLLQLAMRSKKAHPNIKSDAMFPARAFDALVAIVAGAAARNETAGRREEIYEPLEHIAPGLPPTLIHVSGAEALLHDARLAAGKLAAAGVRAEVRVWPGQLHDFQVAAPMLPEATYSLRQIGEYIRQATG